MGIEYELIINNPDIDELKKYLENMPYFDGFDRETSEYFYRKTNKDYPDFTIELHDLGLDVTDYLTGLWRTQVGLLIEHLTGTYDEIIIKEKD